jgi:hypothetical protein
VAVAVAVGLAVGVSLARGVALDVGLGVELAVGLGLIVAVALGVMVIVAVGLAVGVSVGVGVGALRGTAPDSRRMAAATSSTSSGMPIHSNKRRLPSSPAPPAPGGAPGEAESGGLSPPCGGMPSASVGPAGALKPASSICVGNSPPGAAPSTGNGSWRSARARRSSTSL